MNKEVSKIKEHKSAVFPFLDKPVEIYKLENGHTVIIANKHGELVNISTWVRTGSINEDDKINGISHFLEHLMFKGTPEHPAGEFDRILEARGAIVNAATWKDYTFYYVTLPKGPNDEYFEEALDLHSDMMLNASIPEHEIGPIFDFHNPDVKEKRERYVVIEEIRMRDDQPWSKTYNELNHIMYTTHPYVMDVIGTGEIISSVPRQTIVDYYKKWYTADNFITIVVGDVDTEETLNLIREKFKSAESKPEIKVKHPEEEPQTQPRLVENMSKLNTGFTMFGFHGPQAGNLKETIAIDTISIILGEGKSSRLHQNLIEKPETPVFNVVGSGQYQFKDGNTFFIQANFHPSQRGKALELLKVEIRKMIDSPVSQQELDKAKKKLKGRFASESETVSEIGESIGHFMTICDDISCYTNYLNILNTLTVQDIFEISRKYLDLNKVSISVLMPENEEGEVK